MKYYKYNINEFIFGHIEYITPCPNELISKTGVVMKVGGLGCQQCPYYRGRNTKNKTVVCESVK